MTKPLLDEYQVREQRRLEEYLRREDTFARKPQHFVWTCCGGIELHEDDKCPICGEVY